MIEGNLMEKTYITRNDKIFAFNIWDVESAKAVMDAASNFKRNVILQTSTKIYKDTFQLGLRSYVDTYKRNKGINVWLHLDHCKDISIIEDAIKNGWDSVMIDASNEEIEKNNEPKLEDRLIQYGEDKKLKHLLNNFTLCEILRMDVNRRKL